MPIGSGLVALATVAMYTILFMPSYAVRQLGFPPQGAFMAGLHALNAVPEVAVRMHPRG